MEIVARTFILIFIVFILVPLVFNIFNITPLFLPDEFKDFLNGSFLPELFNSLSYFMPVSFGLVCLLFVVVIRHFDLVMSAIEWIAKKL